MMDGQLQRICEASCECCGLKEECTAEYVERVRTRLCGRWLCGLCAEAVNDELVGSNNGGGMADAVNGELVGTSNGGGMAEAVERHMRVCRQFSSAKANPAVDVAHGMSRMLRRSFQQPRSGPAAPRSLTRSTTCISSFPGR